MLCWLGPAGAHVTPAMIGNNLANLYTPPFNSNDELPDIELVIGRSPNRSVDLDVASIMQIFDYCQHF